MQSSTNATLSYMAVPNLTNSDPENHRIVLGLEYDGSLYSGWQRQASAKVLTVQKEVEQALSQVAASNIITPCAGRTDAGVHATHQVLHFDSPVDRGIKAWTIGVNSLLPASIKVLWATNVEEDYHARFSATARRYNYLLYRRNIASAILSKKVTHIRGPLDVDSMDKAAQVLVGEHDFSAFRAAACQSNSPNRCVISANCYQKGAYTIFDVKANAFLLHMVRNFVGALLEIGQSKKEINWMSELLASRDRRLCGVTAPPDGLYLVSVDYPSRYGIPAGEGLPLYACEA